MPIEGVVFKSKWVNVVDVFYTYGGTKRHAYFHPQSKRLERFKEDMKAKILSVMDTRIEKGICWIN